MAEQRDLFDRQQQLFEREQLARTSQAYGQANPSVLDAIEGMQERLGQGDQQRLYEQTRLALHDALAEVFALQDGLDPQSTQYRELQHDAAELLDSIEDLHQRVDALGHNQEERSHQHNQGMSY